MKQRTSEYERRGRRGVSRVALTWACWAAVSLPQPALAAGPIWRDSAELPVKVFDHSFRRVDANDVDCVVRVRLHFDAPAAAYQEPSPVRNHYRFLAEVKLSGGNRFQSEVFSNTEPGARVFAFSHDTALEGCWAKQPLKLRKVDVHACRGAKCVPQKFD
ncbi:MAG TPA: hypothetical protein VFS67_07890 [Polyangiaceae bacterium]|nr:hypothetical protein [Polyangiaceae bacterium]